MRVYISGAITGKPGLNQHVFSIAEAAFIIMGHEPINPLSMSDVDGEWADYIISDLKKLRTADAMTILPGSGSSVGCRIERLFAEKLGIPLVSLPAYPHGKEPLYTQEQLEILVKSQKLRWVQEEEQLDWELEKMEGV